MKQRYLAIFEKAPNNFGGFAPDVTGCGAVGKTLSETRKLLSKGLTLHFEGLIEDGLPIPVPSKHLSYDFSDETPENGVEYCVVEWIDVRMPAKAAARPAHTKAVEKSYA